MSDVHWMHPAMHVILSKVPRDAETILDVGCGRGIMGALCRIYRNPKLLVGLDGFRPYVDFCRAMGFYDECLEWDLNMTPLPFKDKQFDVATCIEVIEHLTKPAGFRLLQELERVARVVIVSTPGTFFEQPEYDGNPLQAHRSFWTVREFVKLGFCCEGVGDFHIRGMRIRYISKFLAPLARKWASFSTLLLCVKNTMPGSSPR